MLAPLGPVITAVIQMSGVGVAGASIHHRSTEEILRGEEGGGGPTVTADQINAAKQFT